MSKDKMIPCFECICLAICKCKKHIICEILYPYLDETIIYHLEDYGQLVGDEKGRKAWDELEELFQKEHEIVTIDVASGTSGMYAVQPKDF